MVLFMVCSCTRVEVTHQLQVDDALDKSKAKVVNTLKSLDDSQTLPRVIRNGDLHWTNSGISSWTSGFFPGILWYMYDYTGDDFWLNYATYYTRFLEPVRRLPWKTHDLGFMMYTSYGHAYASTKNPLYLQYLMESADSLATLFNPNVGAILSWPWMKRKRGWSHNTIIDNMMNLELLFWASKNGGPRKYYEMAVQHAEVTQRDFIRPDNGTHQIVVYDSLTGEVETKCSEQGLSDESVWSRGQAWALYGFVVCYRETGLPEFLNTAQNLADYFIDNLPEDHIPNWDFMAPDIPYESKDASAAAIAASALVELSGLMEDLSAGSKYLEYAEKILAVLSSDIYQSQDNDAILRHCVGSKPQNSEVGVSLIYADYYYIEALIRLHNVQKAERVAGM